MLMKNLSTQKLRTTYKTKCNCMPNQSSINHILAFAAAYETPKTIKGKFPGFVLN